MSFIEKLKEQLFYYHNATDIALELVTSDGKVLESYSGKFRYCSMVQEACGDRRFCERMHKESAELSAELGEGYIFSCPAGLVHFLIPVIRGNERHYILAGPMAMDYPDISVVDSLIQGYGLSVDIRQRLFSALNSVPIVEPVRIQHLCKLLFALVNNLASACNDTEDDGEEGLPAPYEDSVAAIPMIQKAVSYIDMHYDETLRLETVAAYVGLNPSYFSSIFKRELNISFSNYLTQKRIEEACGLLINTNHALSDIALETGFENQSYFSKIFKEHTGMTPKEYRKRS